MNFAAFSAIGPSHFVTTSGQVPVQKIQQNVANNGNLTQMVGMVDGQRGVQYVRTMEGAMQPAPQVISVPIALPGSKPGDPQAMVQIQVLNPSILQQQQPKYQMQIPIQGLQQGGAVLTVAYSGDNNDGSGIQLLQQNAVPESGLQLLTALPQEMQLIQPAQMPPDEKPQIQHQVVITPNQQVIIKGPDDVKMGNIHNNNNDPLDTDEIIIKQECEDNTKDEDMSKGQEACTSIPIVATNEDLVNFLKLQQKNLPESLQQFLKLHKDSPAPVDVWSDKGPEPVAEAIIGEDGTVRIQEKKKKKKYKKRAKPARPRPGQVIIANTADGTPIFCCPECTMAYPEKEQLELHLVTHKIERRFICGICGAALKRKEHLERHKLGHNPSRPYVCGVCNKGFKRREHLNLHAVIHSGVKTEMCNECGKGFYRKDHLRKHTRSHESKRARDEAAALTQPAQPSANTTDPLDTSDITFEKRDSNNSIMPEIIVHVPTSSNVQMPVQINIPQQLVSSLSAQSDAHAHLDALLAQHT